MDEEEREALIRAAEQILRSEGLAPAEERTLDPSEADRRRREVLQAPLAESLISPIRRPRDYSSAARVFHVEPMWEGYRPTLWEHILE